MITILYDNSECPAPLESAWGFSCLIDGFENTILFDTGDDGEILFHNMNALDVDPGMIDTLVISHNHWDHAGGLEKVLENTTDITAYIPAVFPDNLKTSVTESGGNVVETRNPTYICDGVLTTPVMGDDIPEQGLLVHRDAGWTLITGCAHPGIAKMTARAKETVQADISSVLGGFHLKDEWNTTINHTTAELQDMGVQEVGACHCSGDAAREKMSAVFGDQYLDIAAGTRIE